MERPQATREEIIKLSQHNALLHQVLQYWHLGKISYEEALQIAVIALTDQNNQLERRLKDCLSMSKHYVNFELECDKNPEGG